MRKNFISCIILLALFLLPVSLLPSVSASTNCRQYSCSGQNLPGDLAYDFTVFGSSYKNRMTSYTYNLKTLSANNGSMLMSDMDNDGVQDIVFITNNNQLTITKQDGTFIASLDISGSKPRSTFILTNMNENEYQEVAMLNGSALNFYEYDAGDMSFSLIYSANYTNFSKANKDKFACTRATGNPYYCLLFKNSHQNITVLEINNLTSHTAYRGDAVTTSAVSFYLPLNPAAMPTFSKTISGIEETAVCGTGLTGVPTLYHMQCRIYNSTGNITATIDHDFNEQNSLSAANYYDESCQYARMGSYERFICWRNTHDGITLGGGLLCGWNQNVVVNGLSEWLMMDLDGNYIIGNTSQSSSSIPRCIYPPVVADYNKDGTNELLIYGSNKELVVYNALGQRLYRHGFSTINSSVVVADFNTTNPFMCLGGMQGIECIDSNETVKGMFNTSVLTEPMSNTNREFRFWAMSIVSNPASLSPVYAWSDNTFAYIVLNQAVADTCGNGICDPTENEFSCAVDCGLAKNGSCSTDSDCKQPYPKCLYGLCVAGFSNISCISDSQCPLNASVCYNNYCVAGIYKNATTNFNQPPQINTEADINNLWNLMFQGSLLWRLVIGMILLLVIVGTITMYLNPTFNPVFLIFTIAVVLVILTLVQLIPIWVIAITIILGISIFALYAIIFKKPGEA